MFTKRRRQYKKHITNHKRKTQKKSRKFRTKRNKKYSGGGTWINVDNLDDVHDICPICLQKFSETPTLAIYKTYCGHIYHNNCLNESCNSTRGIPKCPTCRSVLQKAAIGKEPAREDCTEVSLFERKELNNPNILDKKNREIYNAQSKPLPARLTSILQGRGDLARLTPVLQGMRDLARLTPREMPESPMQPMPPMDMSMIGRNRPRRITDEDEEEEVFRIEPVVGRCYDHVEATRREGRYPNTRYFAPTLNRVNVGRFVREERRGFGDGQQIYAIFVDNNGQERRVQYSNGGNTCFIEISC